MATKIWAMTLVFLSTLITASGQIFLKIASEKLTFDIILLITNYALWIGSILYFIGAGILIVSLKYGELSVLYPIYAMSYVWVSLFSPMFFKTDSMNLTKWIGIFVIIIGVSLIGIGSSRNFKKV